MSERQAAIQQIANNIKARQEPPRSTLDTQVLCLAEEVGEAIQAYRRATGRARSTATWQQVAEELADVVIVAYVTAELAEIDLEEAIDNKLKAIKARGGI